MSPITAFMRSRTSGGVKRRARLRRLLWVASRTTPSCLMPVGVSCDPDLRRKNSDDGGQRRDSGVTDAGWPSATPWPAGRLPPGSILGDFALTSPARRSFALEATRQTAHREQRKVFRASRRCRGPAPLSRLRQGCSGLARQHQSVSARKQSARPGSWPQSPPSTCRIPLTPNEGNLRPVLPPAGTAEGGTVS